ncbi:MAG: hypothetical protein GY863_08430 [bacterium]|nr:hypothetical protein [bacterium]
MNCPDCDNEMLEGKFSVFETLWGKLLRDWIFSLFVGDSWKKLTFRPKNDETDESYVLLPSSRSVASRDGYKCMKCGCVFIDKVKSRFSDLL